MAVTVMDDLIAFIKARRAEDDRPLPPHHWIDHVDHAYAIGGLFQIAYLAYIDDQTDEEAQQMLRLLGLFYSDSSDYRAEEWKPMDDETAEPTPELPNLPWTVRDKDGKAVAAYADKRAADAHAAREDGWTVTPDQWAAQNPDPKQGPWKS